MAKKIVAYSGKASTYGPAHDNMHRAGIYAYESASIAYDAGTGVALFSVVPDNFVLFEIAIEVTTAFDGVNSSFTVTDANGNLAIFSGNALSATGYVSQPVFRRYAKVAGAGNAPRSISADVVSAAGATAGAAKVWILIRPVSAEVDPDNA